MKTLAVCGDSYMSAVGVGQAGYRQHFTELLADRLGWNYVTFARGGCSNTTIRLQIDEVLKLKPDLVIIGTTSNERFEYPGNRNETSLDNRRDGVYVKELGLANINYGIRDRAFDLPMFRQKNTLISATLSNMLHPELTHLTEEQFEAWEKYYQYCYDANWKKQIDTWLIVGGLRELQLAGIPFYLIANFMYNEDLQSFKKHEIVDTMNRHLCPWRQSSKNVEPRFHTSVESQQFMAENWYQKLIADGTI